MDTELYIETIKKKCAFLEQEGYILTQLENNVFYTKEAETVGFRIRFSWLEYGDKFVTHGLTAEKRFNIIEKEIQKILGGNLSNYYTIHKSLSSVEYIPQGLEFTQVEENIRFAANTVNDIELFAEILKIFYSKTALEFFNNYEGIDSINSQLKELLDTKKIQTVLTSIGNTTILRFYTIAFLSVNKTIMDFFSKTYFPYLNNNLDNELKKIESDRFKLLKSNLHTTV